MNENLKVGSKIEFESGSQFEVIKIFPEGYVDLRSLTPHELLPDYYPVYYSVVLENYKILPDENNV